MILVEQIIAQYLKLKDIGTNPADKGAWPVFTGRIPTDPNNAIAVHRDSVPTEGREQRFGTVHHEGFQIRVRHTKYEDGQKKILEIAEVLDKIRQHVLAVGTKQFRIQGITQLVTPVFIGPDPNNRLNFSLNCMAAIHEL